MLDAATGVLGADDVVTLGEAENCFGADDSVGVGFDGVHFQTVEVELHMGSY